MRGPVRHVPVQLWVLYSFILLTVATVTATISGLLSPSAIPCPPLRPSLDEITFISVPRPLSKDDQYRRMKLAISSWLACSPSASVLLFINRTEFDPSGRFPTEIDDQFGGERVIYAGGIRTDHSGVPYIHEWFLEGIRQTPSRFVCFINSDILLSAKWLSRVKQVYNAIGAEKQVVLIGQRIDFELTKAEYKRLRFTQKDLLGDIDAMVERSSHSDHSPYGIDTFTFAVDPLPFDPDLIPPYIMGRYNWDNWLIGWWNKICNTVTFNLAPPIYHINHVRHSFDVNDSKVAINHHLKRANKNYFGSNYDTKWQILPDNILARRRGNESHDLGPLS
jgi:hypothetical protein